MYKREFTLKQHTPLIHHLGNKNWSGLQTKAVSPMLNKFIVEKTTDLKRTEAKKKFIENFKNACPNYSKKEWNAGTCRNCNIQDCKYKGWFRNKKEVENLAFNYDLSFECEIDQEASYQSRIMMANRDCIFYKEKKVKMKVICSVPSLLEKIEEMLPEFFILTGFGYNSSKGYGCFTVSNTSEEEIKKVLNEKYKVDDQVVFFTNALNQSPTKLINQHWKYIKSGINFPDRDIYHKSLLWYYFCGQYGNQTGWEKRFIKEALKYNHESDFWKLKRNMNFSEMRFEDTKNVPDTFQFFRALLGMAENYEYVTTNRQDDNLKIVVKPDNQEIERIPSPVKFKVFYNTIYLIVDSVNEIINNTSFKFYYKGTELMFNGMDSLSIQIPKNGLKDCFEQILLQTKKFDSKHPLIGKYNPLT